MHDANFIVMFYFIHGFVTVGGTRQVIWVLLELIFASLMFIGCTYYARHRGQELGLKIRKLKKSWLKKKPLTTR